MERCVTMKIAIIGTGYVGLTTGVCLAELGHNVLCHDINGVKIASLNRSICPIFEPGMQELMTRNIRGGRLQFTTRLNEAVFESELVFLAVNTPSDQSGNVDLSFVLEAVRSVAALLESRSTLVVKSTVPPGTADRIAGMLQGELGRPDIHVASNPEFLREGRAITDFLNPDRVVIGVDDSLSARRLSGLFTPLIDHQSNLLITRPVNAEMVKYAANAFLALRIAFINNVADLCEGLDGQIDDVVRGIGLDHRIGDAFLSPGPGFGGSCFPKDTRGFAACGRAAGAPQPLVEALIQENEDRKARLADRIVNTLGRSPAGAKVAVLGTAFKADTDDMRQAPALTVIPVLQHAGIKVAAHDPRAGKVGQSLLPDVEWHADPMSAAQDADAVVILTEWEMYRRLDLRALSRRMRGRHLFDYRNLFDAETVNMHGLHYTSLGRPPAMAADELSSRLTTIAAAAE